MSAPSLYGGSSPLTRGKLPGDYVSLCRARLIPAHAGKTRVPRWYGAGNPAHPRSRGENKPWKPLTLRSEGSSPLTRGKPWPSARQSARGRLIPAHAGKTRITTGRTCVMTAHPRSRGENSSRAKAWTSPSGSSPLTRGKPDNRTGVREGPGLIPAHAGKTP